MKKPTNPNFFTMPHEELVRVFDSDIMLYHIGVYFLLRYYDDQTSGIPKTAKGIAKTVPMATSTLVMSLKALATNELINLALRDKGAVEITIPFDSNRKAFVDKRK